MAESGSYSDLGNGTGDLRPGAWSLELGTWNLGLGTWALRPGTWSLEFIYKTSLAVYQLKIFLLYKSGICLSPEMEYLRTFVEDQ